MVNLSDKEHDHLGEISLQLELLATFPEGEAEDTKLINSRQENIIRWKLEHPPSSFLCLLRLASSSGHTYTLLLRSPLDQQQWLEAIHQCKEQISPPEVLRTATPGLPLQNQWSSCPHTPFLTFTLAGRRCSYCLKTFKGELAQVSSSFHHPRITPF